MSLAYSPTDLALTAKIGYTVYAFSPVPYVTGFKLPIVSGVKSLPTVALPTVAPPTTELGSTSLSGLTVHLT